MAGLGVIKGVGEDRFDMNSSIKRGDLAAMLFRLSNGKAGQDVAFNDVPGDKYYADGVAWASMVGIVQGDGKGFFRPESTLTREEMAVMLHRYAMLLHLDTASSAKVLDKFTDQNKTHGWAKDSVAWCVEQGIVQGKGGGVLDPAAEVTRAETASMLLRFLNLLK
jgi:hypothetical protein